MTITTLESKLDKIRSNPRLENQQQTQVVLAAVEDTLRDQKSEATPTAYFAALLSLLGQFIPSSKGIVNRDVATAVVYLLDLVTPCVPTPLLRSKFAQILKSLAVVLTHPDAEAPLLRASIGCLESLLVVQDGQAWSLSQAEISPRRAVAGLLALAVDHRPKVRKRALEALSKILKNPPPSPSLDHPAADMCAESALMTLKVVVDKNKKQRKHQKDQHHGPSLMHALQLVKTVALASGGWPSRKIESLCEVLLGISRSSNEHLTMAAFEVFEVMFAGMTDEMSSAKLPRLLEVIGDLQPFENDSQLLPPWLAVVSRGYDVAAQVNAEETFQNLPQVFEKISNFLNSMSHSVRVSTSECLMSLMVNCIPVSVVLEPSVFDEKILERLAKVATDLLSIKYQSAWMEVFALLSCIFDNLRWRSTPILDHVVRIVGELRGNGSFNGKAEADAVISKAIRAMGPDRVLSILPLNIGTTNDSPGRAWMLPLLRDAVGNTRLSHFRSDLVPLSEKMFQRILDHKGEKTMEIRVFETVVYQIWATLPGYCDLPVDLQSAFDQAFAEQIANLLYQRTELRSDLCRALQNLVDSNVGLPLLSGLEAQLLQSRVSVEQSKQNLEYLASFASNLLAVLFNVYTQTLPSYRGPILKCINAYLSITPEKGITETFERVVSMLDSSITEAVGKAAEKRQKKEANGDGGNAMPPMSHTLMDLITTISVYLPRTSLTQLFTVASTLLKEQDPNLQKKAYKIIPRLAESEAGQKALKERSSELQQLILDVAGNASSATRKDRLAALEQILTTLPDSDLHFIPSIIPEVVMSTKEQNEKARTAAYELLVMMGDRMREGGTIHNSRVPHMPADSAIVEATLDEYVTMVSAGLAGTSPHAISATVAATARILHEFHESLSETTIKELVETTDIFLKNPNREIVRSVLGFIKCCVLDLRPSFMVPRLDTIIPSLLAYEHEHKGALQAKVKHIFERMIRKYGFTTVEKHTPEQGRKLIHNIRKTKERAKRKRHEGQGSLQSAEDVEATAGVAAQAKAQKQQFPDAFDEAVYGSDMDDASGSGSDASDDEILGRAGRRSAAANRGKQKGGETYIIEDEEEPLDLLDRKALGRISSTRPLGKPKPALKRKAKTDVDGKLVITEDDVDDSSMRDSGEMDPDVDHGDGTIAGGINAYVAAIRGRDVAKRGKQGKLKFSNKRGQGEGEQGIDEEDVAEKLKGLQVRGKRDGRVKGTPLSNMRKARMQRRGLGAEKQRSKDREKVHGGRVQKSRGSARAARRRR